MQWRRTPSIFFLFLFALFLIILLYQFHYTYEASVHRRTAVPVTPEKFKIIREQHPSVGERINDRNEPSLCASSVLVSEVLFQDETSTTVGTRKSSTLSSQCSILFLFSMSVSCCQRPIVLTEQDKN